MIYTKSINFARVYVKQCCKRNQLRQKGNLDFMKICSQDFTYPFDCE